MFFDSWLGVLRVVVVGTLAYAGLILVLRATGKRTLSKMNAFDFVVTIALGSTLATVLLSKEVPLIEGLTALILLTLLQFVVTWLSIRWPWIRRVVTAQPTLVFYRGEFLAHALRRVRISQEEILAAVRQAGLPSLGEVEAVVLETTGDLSVLRRDAAESHQVLRDVQKTQEVQRHERTDDPPG